MDEYNTNSDGSDLKIGTASHAFSSVGADLYIKQIRTDLVNSLITAMQDNFKNIEIGVHKAWVGKSADVFLLNCKDQIRIVGRALVEAFKVVENVVYHAQHNMNNLDQTLVQRRGEGGNE